MSSSPSDTIRVRVTARRDEAVDIVGYDLAAEDGTQLPAFTAGAHVDVHVAPGLIRQYSLCNDPSESDRYQIAVLREPLSRGGSVAVHERLQEGVVIEIGRPVNRFPLTSAPANSLLLAGGIGITPIVCMAERLATLGASFELHYCTRSVERTAFAERIRSARFASNVAFHHDDGDPGQRMDISEVIRRNVDPSSNLYVCGPKGFIDAVLSEAAAQGWPEAHLHREYFAADSVSLGGDDGFEVQLARSGRIVAIPASRTVVEALAEAGVDVPTSCEQGVCGTCMTRVLEGIPDHRDLCLTPQEQAANDQFTPCCSRSKSARLVLDL